MGCREKRKRGQTTTRRETEINRDKSAATKKGQGKIENAGRSDTCVTHPVLAADHQRAHLADEIAQP
jgi:Tfp pilus assembly major pilin PilA